MKEKCRRIAFTMYPGSLKLLKVKLTGALLLLTCLQVWAHTYSQDRITLKLQDADLKKTFQAIEQQSKYRFLYNEALIANKSTVDIDVREADINTVLDRIFKKKGIDYQLLENNLIVLKSGGRSSARLALQDIPVTGSVRGANGEVLSGVSVSLKGSQLGTTTDAAGNFSINVPDAAAVLVFSYVGYGTQEITVGAQTTITVTMSASSTTNLNEVIVVGYGTQRRREVTGSVASVRGAELAKQPVLTATQAVQGKVAGVQVISSGDPNSLPTIRIRGTGTMLGGASPLYVVDGIINDDIRNINSADIVSMDILKDASATAIYGMRAANGVVLITTKKGRTGRMVISYDATMGIKEAARLVNMAGPAQYANYINESQIYYNNQDSTITQQQLAQGGATDWYDEVLKKGFFQNHNVSLSGGSDKITYFFSAGYLSDEGIIHTNKFNRFTLRSNNEYKITNALKLSALLSYSRSTVRNVDLGVFNVAYRAAPYVFAKRDGKFGNTSLANNVGNPILDLEKNNNSGLGNRIQGNFAIDFKPITWLALRSSLGVDVGNFRSTNYGYRYENVGENNVFLTAGSNQVRNNSNLTVSQAEGSRYVWDNTATITQSFGEHNLSLLLGTTAEAIRSNTLAGTRLNVPEDKDQWYLNAGSSIGATNTNDGDLSTRSSYLSRLTYNFNDRFFLSGVVRADGTSRLPENNRWGYFPSLGAAWNIGNEKFMGGQEIFSTLKLRASWGRVGNDQIGSNVFRPLAAQNIPYFFNGTEYLGIAFNELADVNVKWEVTEEADLGLDFAILRGKLSGTIDFYNKKTKDALVRVNIPAILGDQDNRYITNAASFTNKGVELGLDWNNKIGKDWSYNLNGNVAFNKNSIDNLNGGEALFDGGVGGFLTTKSDNGQPIGSFFLLETDGIFQNEAEVAGSAQLDAKPGDLRYRDVNGDKVINDNDRVFQGSYQPKVTFGFNGSVNFRALDFSFGTYGTAGGKIYNGKKAARGDFRDNIETEVAKNRWTPNNPGNDVPRANTAQLRASTYFLEKGDFFRINNLTLGYKLPGNSLTRLGMQNLRVFATIQNLATITSYSGFTPEINNGSTLAGGIELGIYPTTRTFAFGVNVGF